MPKKGSKEYKKMHARRKEFLSKKKEEEQVQAEETTPVWGSRLLITSCVPQTYWMYELLWADPLSEACFTTFQLTYGWIATQTILDGAGATALGYSDYLSRNMN